MTKALQILFGIIMGAIVVWAILSLGNIWFHNMNDRVYWDWNFWSILLKIVKAI